MRTYRSAPRTQELQWKQFMSLPAFPQSSLLPHMITPTSALKTALVKLVVTHILLWGTMTNIPPTQLSVSHQHFLKTRYIIRPTSTERMKQFSLHSFFWWDFFFNSNQDLEITGFIILFTLIQGSVIGQMSWYTPCCQFCNQQCSLTKKDNWVKSTFMNNIHLNS